MKCSGFWIFAFLHVLLRFLRPKWQWVETDAWTCTSQLRKFTNVVIEASSIICPCYRIRETPTLINRWWHSNSATTFTSAFCSGSAKIWWIRALLHLFPADCCSFVTLQKLKAMKDREDRKIWETKPTVRLVLNEATSKTSKLVLSPWQLRRTDHKADMM